jgi:hypothetical protein
VKLFCNVCVSVNLFLEMSFPSHRLETYQGWPAVSLTHPQHPARTWLRVTPRRIADPQKIQLHISCGHAQGEWYDVDCKVLLSGVAEGFGHLLSGWLQDRLAESVLHVNSRTSWFPRNSKCLTLWNFIKALESSCPELMGNMDEMWRRQMRDDRLRTLHFNANLDLDRMPATAVFQFEQRQAPGHSRCEHAGGLSSTASTRVTLQVPMAPLVVGSCACSAISGANNSTRNNSIFSSGDKSMIHGSNSNLGGIPPLKHSLPRSRFLCHGSVRRHQADTFHGRVAGCIPARV